MKKLTALESKRDAIEGQIYARAKELFPEGRMVHVLLGGNWVTGSVLDVGMWSGRIRIRIRNVYTDKIREFNPLSNEWN